MSTQIQTRRVYDLTRQGTPLKIPTALPTTREAAIAELMWSSGGTGFGICSFAASALWAEQRPGPGHKDWSSTVTIRGTPELYTDAELISLVKLSRACTARYDELFGIRMGANLIVVEKERKFGDNGYHWFRKRMSWEMGRFYSDTLENVFEVFEAAAY